MAGVPFDGINLSDDAWAKISQPKPSDQLPFRMACKAGHLAERQLIGVSEDLVIPYYLCLPCQVVYRYQECTLPPGDEGLPDAQDYEGDSGVSR